MSIVAMLGPLENMKRVFFAINLSAETKHELAGFIASFSPNYKKTDIRWVDEQNLHCTLHFLGDQSDQAIESLKTMARTVASEIKIFSLETSKISAFPSIGMARIIFLETRDDRPAKMLVRELGKHLRMAGFEIDQRSWHAHITIGRARNGAPLRLVEQFPEHQIDVKSFELMQSELGPQGPTYQILESFPLQS